ncbi:MAG: hypothetical protein HGA66_09095 [Holophaga sp.]|nr:hypothetical protein [Holophaga sp.]
MLKHPHRATLVLAGLVLAASTVHAEPSDANAWSKVENKSKMTYTLTNVDLTGKTSFGTLWCKKADEKGNGTAIKTKGQLYHLTPGSHLFYFETNLLSRFAMHLDLLRPRNKGLIKLHVTNMPAIVTGTEIQVAGAPLSDCNIIIDPTGYRNLKGGTLFTIKDPDD